MLNDLYTLLEKKENFFSIKLADKHHPVFKAHFPSNPILPGFIMLEIISEVIDMEITDIKKIKFLNPVLPQDELSFVFEENIVIIKKESVKVSQIVFNKI